MSGEKWPDLQVRKDEFISVRGYIAHERFTTGGTPAERYVPVSSPRCLTKEEARLLTADGFSPDESLAGLPALRRRLSDWAGEGTES